MKQLRIDFPDYTSEQQDRDVKRHERLKKTEVYLSKVEGIWNAIIPKKHNIVINGNKSEGLTEFVEGISKDLQSFGINPRFRNVRNEGIDAHFRYNQNILRRFNNDRD